MKLIVGLGNVGIEYENTRHNVGFDIIDKIHSEFSFPNFNDKHNSLFSKSTINNIDVILQKPTTYMNLSGKAVSAISQFFKINPKNIIVIHDDLDLELGKLKVKIGGGDGGHNGLRSVDNILGKNYLRVRVGIGRPQYKNDVSNFVLSKFTSEESVIMEVAYNNIIKTLSSILNEGVVGFNREWSKINL